MEQIIIFGGITLFIGLFCIIEKIYYKPVKKEVNPKYLRYTYYEPV